MAGKQKISVTVASDVLGLVDREARRAGATRSYTIERWLRAGALRAAEASLEDATAAYYASLRPEEQAEAEAIGRAGSKAAQRATYDAAPRRRPRTRAR